MYPMDLGFNFGFTKLDPSVATVTVRQERYYTDENGDYQTKSWDLPVRDCKELFERYPDRYKEAFVRAPQFMYGEWLCPDITNITL